MSETSPAVLPDLPDGVRLATTPEEIDRCHAVMVALRPHLQSRTDFVALVRRMQAEHDYGLAYLAEGERVVACAGYRVLTNLAHGTFLYVDDLVTAPDVRSRGHGARLMAWLEAEARRRGCRRLHLDSGVQRFGAHRFYFAQGMHIASYHFAREL